MHRQGEILIDFNAEIKEIDIMIDKDDGEAKGFAHATRLLRENSADFETPPYSIWYFGLRKYSIHLKVPIKLDLLKLIPMMIDNNLERPFWFSFKHSLRWKRKEKPDETFFRLDMLMVADLSYGALTSMSCFKRHDEFSIRKRGFWGIRFFSDLFSITARSFRKETIYSPEKTMSQKKYRFRMDMIDRAVVFQLYHDGFCLFINMKGNVHELVSDDANQWKRKGIHDERSTRPQFSTVCFRVFIEKEEKCEELLKMRKEKEPLLTRSSSTNKIREIFFKFIEFFEENQIIICFGSISIRKTYLSRLDQLHCHSFNSFKKNYSWWMLCNTSFRLLVKMSVNPEFQQIFFEYAKKRENENEEECDERFYCLALYLHRQSYEYYFLDILAETNIGIKVVTAKLEQVRQLRRRLRGKPMKNDKAAYVPSILVTPTTILVRPLKFCKLNRVLREERFGGSMNFALVELRDEAQQLLFPSVFRSLRKQIRHYLTDGIRLSTDVVYQYLHHSQSQVKAKQLWFYYHDKTKPFLSHRDAYLWMGNFDKERVVAKHSARIALCFTSSQATIQVRDLAFCSLESLNRILSILNDSVFKFTKISRLHQVQIRIDEE